MVFKTNFDRSQETGKFEIIYESFESLRFFVCECEFLNVMNSKESGLHINESANCRFYDKRGNNVANIILTNIEAQALCESKKGLSILSDRYVIIPSYSRNGTKCVDLFTNKVLWKSPISKLTKVFIYKDKIFCEWSASSGGLTIISAESGKTVKNIFKYKLSGETLNGITTDRINERYLLAYDNGYFFVIDMKTDKIELLEFVHKPQSEFFNFSGIKRNDDSRQITLRFKDFVTTGPLYMGGEAKWIFEEKTVNIEDLLKSSISNPFGKNIPTDSRQLKEIYCDHFGTES